jgi:hypothetical protein
MLYSKKENSKNKMSKNVRNKQIKAIKRKGCLAKVCGKVARLK